MFPLNKTFTIPSLLMIQLICYFIAIHGSLLTKTKKGKQSPASPLCVLMTMPYSSTIIFLLALKLPASSW